MDFNESELKHLVIIIIKIIGWCIIHKINAHYQSADPNSNTANNCVHI